MPRDAAAEVSDLENGLKAARIASPYVLVGHSLGGMEMRLFAYRHPDQVVGLLLIDPGIEHRDRRLPYPPGYLKRQAGKSDYDVCLKLALAGKLTPGVVPKGNEDACVPLPNKSRPREDQEKLVALWEQPAMYEAILSEMKSSLGPTSDEMDVARRKLGSIPLIVLSSDEAHFTADRPKGVDADAFYAAWIAAHVDQARDSRRGEHKIVEGASHFIFIERPDAVLTAFQKVINVARTSGASAADK